MDVRRAYQEGRFELVREEEVSVSTTPTSLRRHDNERVKTTITNLGSVPVYIAFSKAVSTSRGIVAGQNGGGANDEFGTDGASCYREIWGVVGSGTAKVLVQEWRIYE